MTGDEFGKIEEGFEKVKKEWEDNSFEAKEADEDIHTANERRLCEIIGNEVGGKLHTGRSRNEQIATDMRLWLRDELRKIDQYLVDLLRVMTSRAEIEIELLMPGYTHLQRAQPVRWSHWLLSYGMAFAADLQRLRETIKRVNRSPLGCGALSGNPFGIDREAMAKELGFEGLMWNSMAAVADRDFALESIQWSSFLMSHVSRLAEDLIIHSTAEFGYVKLSDAYSTGSSLMPQKHNPDSLELLRGKSGRVFGQACGLQMSIKSTPSTYNKDLQESVEPMIDCVKTVGMSVQILTGVVSTMKLQKEKMLDALSPDMVSSSFLFLVSFMYWLTGRQLAIELAEFLVRKGVPFRETHHISGRIVALAEKQGLRMDKLSVKQIQSVDDRFDDDVKKCFDYERSVEMRSAKGGTSKISVLEQIAVLKDLLESKDAKLDAWGEQSKT